MLHSLALSGRMWEPVLGDFTARHDVIAADFRGHGGSDWDGGRFGVADLVADLAALLDALGIERCHVLGLSLGGSVAALFASSYPHRVDRLVLVDTTAWYGPDGAATWAERAATAAQASRESQIPFQVDRWFSERFRRTDPDTVSHAVGIFLATAPRAHAAACLALGELDARGELGAITAPALVVTGEQDQATPPAMGRALADGIAGAIFQGWPGLRHFSVLESAAVRADILAFLDGTDPR
jgi:3-oxoadipate enol-lactonase